MKKRKAIALELLSTEKSYVQSLKNIVDIYMNQIKVFEPSFIRSEWKFAKDFRRFFQSHVFWNRSDLCVQLALLATNGERDDKF